MVPVVRIKDETWERLKHWAIPLEDTPDDALHKVLDVAERHRHCPTHLQEGNRISNTEPVILLDPSRVISECQEGELIIGRSSTSRSLVPLREYEMPILESIHELEGSAPRKKVLAAVKSKMNHLFGDAELEMIPSGQDIRWRKRTEWTRFILVHNRGLLKRNSPPGIWELTEQGYAAVESLRR